MAEETQDVAEQVAEAEKIKELTPEQEAAIPGHIKKWIEIGLKTGPSDREAVNAAISRIYELVGLAPVDEIIWMSSPLSAIKMATALSEGIEIDRDALNADAEAYPELLEDHRDKAVEHLNNFCYSQHDANWLSLYTFFTEEVGLKIESQEHLECLVTIAKGCGWFLPYDTCVIFSERAAHLSKNEFGMHQDLKKAVEFPDGWSYSYLNGVYVDDWISLTPVGELDPGRIVEILNAEVRREFVRKVGIERILHHFKDKPGTKMLDKAGAYELWVLNVGDGVNRVYLKMENPSLPDVWHLEEVEPICHTVQEAINWRAYGRVDKEWKPEKLT